MKPDAIEAFIFRYFVQLFVLFDVFKSFEYLVNVLRSNWSCKKVFSFQMSKECFEILKYCFHCLAWNNWKCNACWFDMSPERWWQNGQENQIENWWEAIRIKNAVIITSDSGNKNVQTFLNMIHFWKDCKSGWPSGLRRCVQVAVYSCRRGFESHSWHLTYFLLICW